MIRDPVQLQSHYCPRCGVQNDMVTPVGRNDHPKPGDFSICYYCACLLQFDENLKLIALTEKELIELGKQEPDAIAHLIACQIKILSIQTGQERN